MVGNVEWLNIAFYELRNVFVRTENEKSVAVGIPSGSAPYSVYITVFTLWKMIVDDVVDIGYVKATGGEVGAHEYVCRAIAKLVE